MRIEFVRQYGVHLPGQVVDHPHDGVADVLVRRGIARSLPVPAVEPVAAVESVATVVPDPTGVPVPVEAPPVVAELAPVKPRGKR